MKLLMMKLTQVDSIIEAAARYMYVLENDVLGNGSKTEGMGMIFISHCICSPENSHNVIVSMPAIEIVHNVCRQKKPQSVLL